MDPVINQTRWTARRWKGFVAGVVIGAVLAFAVSAPKIYGPNVIRTKLAQVAHRLGLGGFDLKKADGVLQCWGDSLTAGAGGTKDHDYPTLVRYLFGLNTVNLGVAGETSAQIEKRLLSRQRTDQPQNFVIWAGRNDNLDDPDATIGNIQQMIDSLLPQDHFLVLGILNSDTVRERRGGDKYAKILRLNTRLSERFASHYMPIREILISKASNVDIEDIAAVESDVVPPSLRSDALHLNDSGSAFVAYAVASAAKGGAW